MGNTQSKERYIRNCILFLIPLLGFYYLFLYRRISRMLGGFESALVFALVVLWVYMLLSQTDLKRNRNFLSISVNGILAVFVYACITFFMTNTLIFVFEGVILLAAIGLAVYNDLTDEKIRSRRASMRNAFWTVRLVSAAGCFTLMVILAVFNYFQKPEETSVERLQKRADQTQELLEAHAEQLRLLREDNWAAASREEKLDVLQVVLQIESMRQGLPEEPEFVVRPDDELTKLELAHYSHQDHQIVMKESGLELSAEENVITMCHECRHAQQYLLVAVYEEANPELKEIEFFDSAAALKENFTDYIRPEDNLYRYLTQECEENATKYADKEKYIYLDAAYGSTLEEYSWKDAVVVYNDDHNAYLISADEKVLAGPYPYIERTWYRGLGVRRYVDENGLVGYLGADGTPITAAVYSVAGEFSHHNTPVWEDGSCYFIGSSFEKVSSDYKDAISNHSYESLVQSSDGKWGILAESGDILFSGADKIAVRTTDSKLVGAVVNGRVVVLESLYNVMPYEIAKEFGDAYSDIDSIRLDCFAVVTARDSGLKGVIDMDGNELFPTKYSSIEYEIMGDYKVVEKGEKNKEAVAFKCIEPDGTVFTKTLVFDNSWE